MRRFGRAAVAATALAAGGGLTVATAATAAPQAPAWHVALTVAGSGSPYFSAVTAASGTSAWAFEASTGKAPAAYRLSGTAWGRRAFPGWTNEQVVAATAAGGANVWAFTSADRALRFDGAAWSTRKRFSKTIGSGLALSSTDVWVFGSVFAGAKGLGAWHFDGTTWTQSPAGSGLAGASALSSTSIWAYAFHAVAHWNGASWTRTSVSDVLPKDTPGCDARLNGIYASSAKSVFAIGTGGCASGRGPFVLLHYNGTVWHRIALIKTLGLPIAIVPDGTGGVWIAVRTGFPGRSTIEHYASGKLSSVALPFAPARLALFGAAAGLRNAAALAVGYTRKSFSATTSSAVILRFGN